MSNRWQAWFKRLVANFPLADDVNQADADAQLGRSGSGPPGIELTARLRFGRGITVANPYLSIDGRLRLAAWGTSHHGAEPGLHTVSVRQRDMWHPSRQLAVEVPAEGYVDLRYRAPILRWGRGRLIADR